MTTSTIQHIPIHHGGRLYQLFGQALETDFAYFSPDYRQGILRANSRPKLQVASLHPKRILLGMYQDSELVGYSISGIKSREEAFLFWLYITPRMRGNKHGVSLLEETEQAMRAKKVDTIQLITHNQQGFYERRGYEMKRIMREIAAGVDMYVMTKDLV